MDAKTLLLDLGRRLRTARRRQGMTLSELASSAGVSRRYATEVEAGRANPTVTKLFQLARAAGIPLRELCDVAPAAFRGGRVALVGLRGAGKSTVGPLLAQRLEVPFEELDRRVEDLAGLELAEIFDLHGPGRFHELEAEALEQVLSQGVGVVVAAGGSIVEEERTFARMIDACHSVWLRAAPEDHFRRVLESGDKRPMRDRPRAMEELRELCRRRDPLYSRCQHAVGTSGKSPAGVAEEILAKLGDSSLAGAMNSIR